MNKTDILHKYSPLMENVLLILHEFQNYNPRNYLSEKDLAMIAKYFPLIKTEKRDYSIEIDPRSVTKDSIKKLSDYGFNRFSLGVQDVNPIVQKAV